VHSGSQDLSHSISGTAFTEGSHMPTSQYRPSPPPSGHGESHQTSDWHSQPQQPSYTSTGMAVPETAPHEHIETRAPPSEPQTAQASAPEYRLSVVPQYVYGEEKASLYQASSSDFPPPAAQFVADPHHTDPPLVHQLTEPPKPADVHTAAIVEPVPLEVQAPIIERPPSPPRAGWDAERYV
jgi:hypothetical protein